MSEPIFRAPIFQKLVRFLDCPSETLFLSRREVAELHSELHNYRRIRKELSAKCEAAGKTLERVSELLAEPAQ